MTSEDRLEPSGDGSEVQPWDWRLAYNHPLFDDDSGLPTFHAYDVNHNAACEPMFGLIATTEPVNEGSHLCASCMTHVRSHPAGRGKRLVAL